MPEYTKDVDQWIHGTELECPCTRGYCDRWIAVDEDPCPTKKCNFRTCHNYGTPFEEWPGKQLLIVRKEDLNKMVSIFDEVRDEISKKGRGKSTKSEKGVTYRVLGEHGTPTHPLAKISKCLIGDGKIQFTQDDVDEARKGIISDDEELQVDMFRQVKAARQILPDTFEFIEDDGRKPDEWPEEPAYVEKVAVKEHVGLTIQEGPKEMIKADTGMVSSTETSGPEPPRKPKVNDSIIKKLEERLREIREQRKELEIEERMIKKLGVE